MHIYININLHSLSESLLGNNASPGTGFLCPLVCPMRIHSPEVRMSCSSLSNKWRGRYGGKGAGSLGSTFSFTGNWLSFGINWSVLIPSDLRRDFRSKVEYNRLLLKRWKEVKMKLYFISQISYQAESLGHGLSWYMIFIKPKFFINYLYDLSVSIFLGHSPGFV